MEDSPVFAQTIKVVIIKYHRKADGFIPHLSFATTSSKSRQQNKTDTSRL